MDLGDQGKRTIYYQGSGESISFKFGDLGSRNLEPEEKHLHVCERSWGEKVIRFFFLFGHRDPIESPQVEPTPDGSW